ncbi:MAG: Ig-like domain repeat protein, partial [Pseudonocardiaceae bacterium]
LSYTTTKAGSTTTLTASPASSVCGQPVTFTATVTPVAPSTGTPTGTVVFTVDGTPSAPVTLAGGVASFTTTLAAGTHTVTATYSGDACFNASTGTLSYTTTKANSSTALFAFPNPSVCGQSVTFTAVVTAVAPGTGSPTGTVTFTVDGTPSAPVPLVGGVAGFSTTLAAGAHTVTATYNGDTCFNTSTASLTQNVTKANSTTTLTASPASSVCGQPVTFTATVTPVAPGTGTPSGTVTFTVNGTPSAPVTLVGGVATFTATPAVGTQTVTAVYSGDSCFNTSTATLTYTTTKANTTTTLTASPNPSTVGQTVTFTATVTAVPPGTGTPSGTVNFSVDGGAPTAVPLVGGQATFSTSTLTAGTHTVTATYSGDSCFNTSTATVTQTVSQGGGAVNTKLTATPATIRLRTNGTLFIPTLSATLTNATTNAPIPGQTITFTANPATGPVTLGTAVTNASGTATLTNVPVSATLTTASQYTATFAGAPGFNPSTASAPLTFQPTPLVP